jgi:hypothetical protein
MVGKPHGKALTQLKVQITKTPKEDANEARHELRKGWHALAQLNEEHSEGERLHMADRQLEHLREELFG